MTDTGQLLPEITEETCNKRGSIVEFRIHVSVDLLTDKFFYVDS